MLTKLFQRTTQSSSFIPEIDGLRFFAIITVVIFHLNTAYSRQLGMDDYAMSVLGGSREITSSGWWIIRLDMGVKVFFAISGMVLALPFLKAGLFGGKKIDLKDYFYRRLTRLEPPFIITLLGFYMVQMLFLDKTAAELLPHMMAGLLYLHTFIFAAPNPINPVTWSLETEAQFYMIVPLLFFLLFRSPGKWYRVAVIAGLFAFSLFFKHYTYYKLVYFLQYCIFAFFTNFITGILFAWLFLAKKEFFRVKHLLWDFAGMAGILFIFIFYKPQAEIINNIFFNTGIFLLMLAAFKGTYFNRFFTLPFVYVVGGMCYTIYLLHYAFLQLLVKFTGSLQTGSGYLPDLLLQFIVALPAILLVSGIFFLLIEKPCMDKRWPARMMEQIKHYIKPVLK